jgi:cation diffusion facilitator CzcD-associated flavoprotein CzcO
VFEKEADVGGVWSASRRYPGLTTQNPKRTYELSDFRMPDEWPEWPFSEQVQSYIEAYTKHFGIWDDILLGTEVTHAGFDAATQTWTVSARRRASSAGQQQDTLERRFDLLIVANGIFSVPFIPDFPGAEEFKAAGGRICHTSEFTDVNSARDRHVIVVGYGKSSCDVANATVGVARSTTVVARNLIWKIPRLIANVVNLKYIFLNRMSEALFPYIRMKGFEKFLHGPGRFIRNGMLDSIEWIVNRQFGLEKIGLRPNKKLETIARSTVSMVTVGFYENIAAGRLRVFRDCRIEALGPGTATLANGQTIPADIIICGTGWQQVIPFLDDEVKARVLDARGNFRLYRSILPVGQPRLLFNGYNSSFFSQLNAEIGAMWILEYIRGVGSDFEHLNRQLLQRHGIKAI